MTGFLGLHRGGHRGGVVFGEDARDGKHGKNGKYGEDGFPCPGISGFGLAAPLFRLPALGLLRILP